MRKPTQEEINDFIRYRSLHVALVQKLGKAALDTDFSKHDSDKIDALGKDLELFTLRHISKSSNLRLSDEDKNTLRKVSAMHAKSQKHHAEYWDDNITVRNFKADDSNVIVAKSMPDRYLAEMACDWAACALFHKEGIFDWYNSVVDNTLYITQHQKDFLFDCLTKIEKVVKKYNIEYPSL